MIYLNALFIVFCNNKDNWIIILFVSLFLFPLPSINFFYTKQGSCLFCSLQYFRSWDMVLHRIGSINVFWMNVLGPDYNTPYWKPGVLSLQPNFRAWVLYLLAEPACLLAHLPRSLQSEAVSSSSSTLTSAHLSDSEVTIFHLPG